ncbi:hypothetical protein EK904_005541 [Melospiza melodia maxima]|nr:hypothetical protein EK904_005541 [Melospiza melodia maxima]
MGQKKKISNALALQVDAEGKIKYDATARQGQSKDKVIYSKYTDLVPKEIMNVDHPELQRPDENRVREITKKTREALEKLVSQKVAAAMPVGAAEKAAPAQYISARSCIQLWSKAESDSGGGNAKGAFGASKIQNARENVLKNLEDRAFDKPICEVLLNQKYFNGIGNYLRAEILYRLKIPPFEKARTVLEALKEQEQERRKKKIALDCLPAKDTRENQSHHPSAEPQNIVTIAALPTVLPNPAGQKENDPLSLLEINQEVAPAVLSSKAAKVEDCIRMYEEMHRLKARERLREWQEKLEQMVRAAYAQASGQLKHFDELRELKRHQEFQELQEVMEKSSKEAQRQQEKLKEEHQRRAKILNLKLREAEQQRQHQEELELLRRKEGQERLHRLYSIQEELLQLNQQIDPSCRHKDLPRMDLSVCSNRGNQICARVSGLTPTTSKRGLPDPAGVASSEQALQEMRGAISSMQQEITAAREGRKRKYEEEKKQNEKELEKREQMMWQTSVPAQQSWGKQEKEGLQVETEGSIMQWYWQLQDAAEQCVAAFSDIGNCRGDTEEDGGVTQQFTTLVCTH